MLRQVDHRLPAVRPPVRERRDRAPVHGIAGGADHRGGDPGARHGLHEREGPPARGRGAEKGVSRSVGVSRGGRNAKVRVASDSESTLVEIHLSPGTGTTRPTGAAPWPRPTRSRARTCPWTRVRGESDPPAGGVVRPDAGRAAREEPYGPMGLRQAGAQGAEHGRTRLQPHEALPQAATRHDRLDETFLANLQLILIAIYLKNTAKNPTSVNTP